MGPFDIGLSIFLAGVIFHAGIQQERITRLRKDHEDERERNFEFRHNRIPDAIHDLTLQIERQREEIGNLRLLVARIIPER